MPNIQIYTKSYCPYCAFAMKTLAEVGLEFEEIEVSRDTGKEGEMRARSQRKTVPQLFIDEVHIGGSDDLVTAIKNGQLAELVAKQNHAA